MRPLVYVMTPVLILTIILAARFVTWEGIKGVKPEVRAAVNAGTAALRTWKLGEAIEAFTRAVEMEPNYAEAYMKRGLAYYRSGRYTAAIADYTRTLDLKRYRADAYASRGDVYRTLGNTEQAVADYTSALKKRWNATVARKRGGIYLQQDDLQAALSDYNAAVKRQPTPTAYYARGGVYLWGASRGDDTLLKAALEDMDQAIDLAPQFAGAYLRRGQIYERLGDRESAAADYAAAVKFLTEGIQTWQGEPIALTQAYLWRAFAYHALGQPREAEADIRETYRRAFGFFLKKVANYDIL